MIKQQVTLLGPLRIIREDRGAPSFRSARARALLGFLIAERRSYSREHLSNLFWPDDEPGHGRTKLRREFYNLTQILPDSWEADRQTIAFRPDTATEVDIYRLLQLEAEKQWEQAAELLRGPFLEGIDLPGNPAFETWLRTEREGWQKRGESILSQLVKQETEQAHHKEALHYGRQLLQLAPWHEETHRQIMLILARTGQRSAALRQYELCKEALWQELSVEPATETTQLFNRILSGDMTPEANLYSLEVEAPPLLASHLPAPITELVGREPEIATITALVSRHRLVNLSGPGGIGKTRLAIAAADRLRSEFQQGVHFVSLLAYESPTSAVPAVADVLSLDLKEGQSPRKQLLSYLRPCQMLLLLDNLEHLLGDPESSVSTGGVAVLIEEILREAPQVKILGTSRELLRLPQEYVFPVGGLDVEGGDIAAGSAVTLFCRRALQRRPELELNTQALGHIRDFCQRVEGMPLAIELAAAQLRTLTLFDLVASTAGGLDAFDAGTRGISARHGSMRLVFDASWKSLSAHEQKIFARLAAFQGGISLQAAGEVAGASISDLSVLLDKSLMRLDPDGRYKRHPLVLAFSAEKLEEMVAEKAAVRKRHFDYFARLLQRTMSQWRRSRRIEDLRILKVEAENLRLAWRWIREQEDQESAVAFMDEYHRFLQAGGRLAEAIELLNRAIETDSKKASPATATYLAHWQRLLGESYLWMSQMSVGDEHLSLALSHLHRAIPGSRGGLVAGISRQALKQLVHRIWPHYFVGRRNDEQGELQDAIIAYQQLGVRAMIELDSLVGIYCTLQAVNLSAAAGLPVLMAETYASTAALFAAMPWHSAAMYYQDKAEKLVEDEDNHRARGLVLTLRGAYHAGTGSWANAESDLHQGAEALQAFGQGWWLGVNYATSSFLALQRGDYERSLYFARAFGDLGRSRGDPGFIAADLYWRALVELRKNRVGQAEAYLQASASAPAEVMNRFDWLVVYSAMSIAYLRQDQEERARRAVGKCMVLINEIARPTHTVSLAGYANIAAACLALWEAHLDDDSYRALARTACSELEKLAGIFAIAKPAYQLYEGSFSWLAGKGRKAHQHWLTSLDCAAELAMPFEQGLAHYEIGRHPLENPDNHSHAHLQQALAVFSELGTPYELARTQHALSAENLEGAV